jgi:predicted transcriptional regulator
MRLRDVLTITHAQFFCSPDLDLEREIKCAFASDLMSDVLRFDMSHGLLITGLANPQIVRTAEMADAAAILLARGKQPQPETVELAEEADIPLLGTELIMFETCGRLWAAGLRACMSHNGGTKD